MLAAELAVLAALLTTLLVPVYAAWRLPVGERRPLLTVVAVALVLRALATVALHSSGAYQITSRGAITPDEAALDRAALRWINGSVYSPVELSGSLHTAWMFVSGAMYDLVWNSMLVVKLLNAGLGAVLVVPVYLLGRAVSIRAARWAAWTMALFPTSLVWSATALREPLIALMITTLLLAAIRLPMRVGASAAAWTALAVGATVALAYTRSYMFPLMLGLLVASGLVVAVARRSWRPAGIVATVALLATLAVMALPTGAWLTRTTVTLIASPGDSIYNPLSDCETDTLECTGQVTPPATAVTRGGHGTIPTTPGRAPARIDEPPPLSASLQSISQKGAPRALAIAVLAGRPVWRSDEFFFLLQPGVVVWWALLPLAAVGAVLLAVRRGLTPALTSALLVGLSGLVVVFLAFTGQFIRHHYMIEPAGIVLAAAGAAELHRLPARVRLLVVTSVVGMSAAALASVALSLIGA